MYRVNVIMRQQNTDYIQLSKDGSRLASLLFQLLMFGEYPVFLIDESIWNNKFQYLSSKLRK